MAPNLQTAFDELTKKAKELLLAKSHDYSSQLDPFANLRACKVLGISPEQGILVRVLDKIARLSTITKVGNTVKDETIEDTCLDVINYMVLFYTMYKEDKLKGALGESSGVFEPKMAKVTLCLEK